jgi:hypothetical protein
MRYERGRVRQAGVTTRRIRDCEKPVRNQIILAGFPLGSARLISLLIFPAVLISCFRLSKHPLDARANKDVPSFR